MEPASLKEKTETTDISEAAALLANKPSQKQLGPVEQLVYSTIRIECQYTNPTFISVAPTLGTGTGFFFGFAQNGLLDIPVIVTNKHVVEGATMGALSFHTAGSNDQMFKGETCRVIVPDFHNQWLRHPDPSVDLCVMPIAQLIKHAQEQGKTINYLKLGVDLIPTDEEFANLSHMEEVLMIGYPNGIWDSVNNMPILRRGITATHPALPYEGRREFMIDAACFPGSSGSPVLLYNIGSYYDSRSGGFNIGTRIKLLGILYAGPQHTVTGELQIVTVPTRQDVQAFSRIPNNLGVVIQSSRLRWFDDELRRMVAASSPVAE